MNKTLTDIPQVNHYYVLSLKKLGCFRTTSDDDDDDDLSMAYGVGNLQDCLLKCCGFLLQALNETVGCIFE